VFRRDAWSLAIAIGIGLRDPFAQPGVPFRRRRNVLEASMRKEYDFSRSRKNPYASRLKRQITAQKQRPVIQWQRGTPEQH
jgi:hypothetical protein